MVRTEDESAAFRDAGVGEEAGEGRRAARSRWPDDEPETGGSGQLRADPRQVLRVEPEVFDGRQATRPWPRLEGQGDSVLLMEERDAELDAVEPERARDPTGHVKQVIVDDRPAERLDAREQVEDGSRHLAPGGDEAPADAVVHVESPLARQEVDLAGPGAARRHR